MEVGDFLRDKFDMNPKETDNLNHSKAYCLNRYCSNRMVDQNMKCDNCKMSCLRDDWQRFSFIRHECCCTHILDGLASQAKDTKKSERRCSFNRNSMCECAHDVHLYVKQLQLGKPKENARKP